MLSDFIDRNGFSPFSTRVMRVKHVLVPSMFVVLCDNTDVIIYTQLIYENVINKENVLELYFFQQSCRPPTVYRYCRSQSKHI